MVSGRTRGWLGTAAATATVVRLNMQTLIVFVCLLVCLRRTIIDYENMINRFAAPPRLCAKVNVIFVQWVIDFSYERVG